MYRHEHLLTHLYVKHDTDRDTEDGNVGGGDVNTTA